MPDVQEAIARVKYDPLTGVFTWAHTGTVAGSPIDERGYIRIRIGRQHFYGHRLAFLCMTGACPQYVDHIDGNRANNAWANLRGATKSQNGMNRGAPKNNTTGFKGVYFQANGYTAEFWVDGRKHYVGRFKTAEQAGSAVAAARRKVCGEFAHA